MRNRLFFVLGIYLALAGCKRFSSEENPTVSMVVKPADNHYKEEPKEAPAGMVWIAGGEFYQGALDDDLMAMGQERPRHQVVVKGFYMDEHEVTNAQFAQFVNETGYVTLAERSVDWNKLRQQLPPGTPKPHDSLLRPGSLVFQKAKTSVPNLYDYSQWWSWRTGANWLKPYGKGSTINGKEDHPVVHIAYEDAEAYCQWAGRRLPTEAEWEFAARGGNNQAIFTWGRSSRFLHQKANTWNGEFPVTNTQEDGFEQTAPVKSYPANAFGLYDMAGNVWEWTSDWYRSTYHPDRAEKGLGINPKGADNSFNTSSALMQEKVIKGGSFLCSASYCASYRISARMPNTIDSAAEHLGFRTVKDL